MSAPAGAVVDGGTFVAPLSIAEAVAALAAGGRIVAGGTDLVVGARQGKWTLPAALIAIQGIEALRQLEIGADGGLVLGALVSHEQIAARPEIQARFTALADASLIVGSAATRHTGTVGGNLMNASPAAETTGPLICFGATVTLVSANGSRRIPLEELATAPGRTSARLDELLTQIEVPAPAVGSGSCYARLEYRRQMEIAVVGATAVVTLSAGRISDARIAISALAPTIHRVPEAERALIGSDGGREAAEAAAAAAADASRPIGDVRAPADYRKAMAAVITRRVILAAVARARGETIAIPASATLVGAA
ncbi:MAG: FAD binding domain-containing protein [Candidatus Limnocylindrales bacterium]